MRVPVHGQRFSVHAISGTHVVLFGFDIDPAQRAGLLGFSLHRTDLDSDESTWIANFLQFELNDRPGGPRTTRDNPIQAFAWGDYALTPGLRLRYRVQALHGEPGKLVAEEKLQLEIRTEASDDGRHGIYFNRGAAGSQAFTRQFGEVSPLASAPARRWLSRGLEEGLTAFIRQATGPGRGLRGAFYEFSHRPILAELLAAHVRNADVKLVVAVPSGSRNRLPVNPTCRNSETLEAMVVPNPAGHDAEPRTFALHSVVVGRTRPDIPHNTFLVLLEGDEPVAVWTGSTNLTDGALYGQSNVGHVVRDRAVAASFLAYWEQLRENPDSAALKAFDERHSPLPAGPPPADATTPLFSPRASVKDCERSGAQYTLGWYAERMRSARQAVFLTAPFGVSKQLQEVLAVDVDFPRYVVLNAIERDDVELQRGDADNHVTGGAYLGSGGWRQFLEEHLTGLNVHAPFVHDKYLLIDPLTEQPLVVTGSANFSDGSTDSNDENMLLISGDMRVADIYLTEFMRLFTHLRFRAKTVARSTTRRAPDPNDEKLDSPLHLDATDAWSERYFVAEDAKFKERVLFRAPPP